MVVKYRQVKADLRKAGFTFDAGKGSHTNWRHPLLPGVKVTLAGHDGDDARRYHVDEVRVALAKLRDVLEGRS